jgi:polyribonucleotide nucleotidyltransferase
MESKVVQFELAGRPFSIEVGRLAKQAGGSALVRYGKARAASKLKPVAAGSPS